MDPSTPAAMVERGTTSAQRKVISTLSELPRAVVDAGLQPPALFVIGPTVRHSEELDWFSGLPLVGERLVVPAAAEAVIHRFEAAGADVVPVPFPVTPAAKLVMAALPVTGCVATTPEQVDWLHEERGGPGWIDNAPAWCVGDDTVARAEARGWLNIRELASGMRCDDLVAEIASRRG
jgi:hypothetical protein